MRDEAIPPSKITKLSQTPNPKIKTLVTVSQRVKGKELRP